MLERTVARRAGLHGVNLNCDKIFQEAERGALIKQLDSCRHEHNTIVRVEKRHFCEIRHFYAKRGIKKKEIEATFSRLIHLFPILFLLERRSTIFSRIASFFPKLTSFKFIILFSCLSSSIRYLSKIRYRSKEKKKKKKEKVVIYIFSGNQISKFNQTLVDM